MEHIFLFYYKLSNLEIEDIFSNCEIEYIREIDENGISGKIVKFVNTPFDTILSEIHSIKDLVKMKGVTRYEVRKIDLPSIKNVNIILPL